MHMALMLSAAAALAVLLGAAADSHAHPHPGQALADGHRHATGVERSVVPFHAPADGALPWGFVEGRVANHVAGYPVIIQMFQDGDPVHFAQADVAADGSYEYRFRVSSGGAAVFEGDYEVHVFKVVYLDTV